MAQLIFFLLMLGRDSRSTPSFAALSGSLAIRAVMKVDLLFRGLVLRRAGFVRLVGRRLGLGRRGATLAGVGGRPSLFVR